MTTEPMPRSGDDTVTVQPNVDTLEPAVTVAFENESVQIHPDGVVSKVEIGYAIDLPDGRHVEIGTFHTASGLAQANFVAACQKRIEEQTA